ncbi:DUF1488 family protein [Mesorhizobium sp. SP-1A]|uniref:DUF1488 family protein n=1 Tax=Mesorhizobium sp. SP-1A TaxID=3077840 RepID=UPI0028F6D9EB|nr:DUF1488 family protein [Mesorhizobium sp. SP-1A]
MSLDFPNRSRSLDAVRNAGRFTGDDGMFQVPFFVEAAALVSSRGEDDTSMSETVCLAAFNAARASVYETAHKVYSTSRRPPYLLTVADFRR